jgi:hypothetical protein
MLNDFAKPRATFSEMGARGILYCFIISFIRRTEDCPALTLLDLFVEN